jgi:hypothetical protein
MTRLGGVAAEHTLCVRVSVVFKLLFSPDTMLLDFHDDQSHSCSYLLQLGRTIVTPGAWPETPFGPWSLRHSYHPIITSV